MGYRTLRHGPLPRSLAPVSPVMARLSSVAVVREAGTMRTWSNTLPACTKRAMQRNATPGCICFYVSSLERREKNQLVVSGDSSFQTLQNCQNTEINSFSNKRWANRMAYFERKSTTTSKGNLMHAIHLLHGPKRRPWRTASHSHNLVIKGLPKPT